MFACLSGDDSLDGIRSLIAARTGFVLIGHGDLKHQPVVIFDDCAESILLLSFFLGRCRTAVIAHHGITLHAVGFIHTVVIFIRFRIGNGTDNGRRSGTCRIGTLCLLQVCHLTVPYTVDGRGLRVILDKNISVPAKGFIDRIVRKDHRQNAGIVRIVRADRHITEIMLLVFCGRYIRPG